MSTKHEGRKTGVTIGLAKLPSGSHRGYMSSKFKKNRCNEQDTFIAQPMGLKNFSVLFVLIFSDLESNIASLLEDLLLYFLWLVDQ